MSYLIGKGQPKSSIVTTKDLIFCGDQIKLTFYKGRFSKGLKSLLLTAPKMNQYYSTSFDTCTQ